MFAQLLSVFLIASESNVSSTPIPQSPAAKETTEPKKKNCKRQPVTGQLQGTKRVCMTAEQWKRAEEESQRSRR